MATRPDGDEYHDHDNGHDNGSQPEEAVPSPARCHGGGTLFGGLSFGEFLGLFPGFLAGDSLAGDLLAGASPVRGCVTRKVFRHESSPK